MDIFQISLAIAAGRIQYWVLKTSKVHLLSIATVAGIGAWCSSSLMLAHDLSASGDPSSALLHLCGSVFHGGCNETSHSAWSDVHLPLTSLDFPVAMLGWIYFTLIAVWYLVQVLSPTNSSVERWLIGIIAVGGGYSSLFLLSLMAFGRVPWCVACTMTHCVNALLITAVLLNLRTRTSPGRPADAGPWRQIALTLALAAAIGFAREQGRFQLIADERQLSDLQPLQAMVATAQTEPSVLLAQYDAQPLQPLLPKPDADMHRLIFFSDLQCPACAAVHQELNDEAGKLFAGRLVIEFHHFPLCRSCNPYVLRDVHPSACDAAVAAEAARRLGGASAFDAAITMLFAHRDESGWVLSEQLADRLHLQRSSYDQMIRSAVVLDAIRADIDLGHSLGVTQTPTLFLDGRRVPDLCLVPLFWKAIASRDQLGELSPASR